MRPEPTISAWAPSLRLRRESNMTLQPALTLTRSSASSKKDTKSIIGPSGVRDILAALAAAGHGAVPTVCIGGVNASNAGPVIAGCRAAAKALDGIAVVSAIVAAADPAAAARDLLAKVTVAMIPQVVRAVAETTPLTHNMTNLVR